MGRLVLTIRTITAIISIAPMITMAQMNGGEICWVGGILITGAGGAGCSLTTTGGAGAGGATGLAIVVKDPTLCGLTVGSTAAMAKK